MLFDVQPQPMWVVDAKTLAFLAVNGAAMRLYGYSKEEFLAHDRRPDPPGGGRGGPAQAPSRTAAATTGSASGGTARRTAT